MLFRNKTALLVLSNGDFEDLLLGHVCFFFFTYTLHRNVSRVDERVVDGEIFRIRPRINDVKCYVDGYGLSSIA